MRPGHRPKERPFCRYPPRRYLFNLDIHGNVPEAVVVRDGWWLSLFSMGRCSSSWYTYEGLRGIFFYSPPGYWVAQPECSALVDPPGSWFFHAWLVPPGHLGICGQFVFVYVPADFFHCPGYGFAFVFFLIADHVLFTFLQILSVGPVTGFSFANFLNSDRAEQIPNIFALQYVKHVHVRMSRCCHFRLNTPALEDSRPVSSET